MLYRCVDLPSDEPIQFVGVYVLRWRDRPTHPTHGFVEAEPSPLEAAAGQLRDACEAIIDLYGRGTVDSVRPTVERCIRLARAALTAAEEAK